jgi:NAD(P)H-hydrate repair Nnr-like enzyme with NAD(P)H-hydrate dehydratase domain
MSAWAAARLACWLLRQAGVRAAEKQGAGLLPTDVPQHIAAVITENH